MSAQRLTDLLNDMKDNNKTLIDLECKLSKFLKCLVSNKNAFLQYDPSLYQKLKDDTKSIEDLSTLFQNKLDLADSIIHQEDITKSQITSADSKDLSCLTFNGERGLQDPHLFQFLSNLEEYFKICRTQWRNQVGAGGAERPPGQQFWGNFLMRLTMVIFIWQSISNKFCQT